jgi:hypothetical protein
VDAIFMVMSLDEFKIIFVCEIVKEAWNIFEVTHEGIKMVRIPTLQMLTLRFKEIRMLKDESFNEFYTKLNDIINSTFNLGEKLEDS